MNKTLFSFFLLLSFQAIYAQHNIIPEPVKYESQESDFVLKDQLKFNIKTKDIQANLYINQFKTLIENVGITTDICKEAKKNSIMISLNTYEVKELGKEGYQLNVSKDKIILTANQSAGIFNGLQTLKQLLPANFKTIKNYKTKSISINGCKIIDYPRFGWRGLMLDVSRHFYTVNEVKAYINQMAEYKFNIFHWHLTDDEGWRIEIKSLPKLTEIGAWRVERYGQFGAGRAAPKTEEKATYGGFYTREDIKEVVQYLSLIHICRCRPLLTCRSRWSPYH